MEEWTSEEGEREEGEMRKEKREKRKEGRGAKYAYCTFSTFFFMCRVGH